MSKIPKDDEPTVPPQYQPPLMQTSQYQPPMMQTFPGDRPVDRVNCCYILLAFFLPPLAVLLRSGCGANVLINICLLCLGWIPGVIHAYYVLLRG